MYTYCVDLILILLFASVVIRAFKRGFLNTVAGVASAVGAILAGVLFGDLLEGLLFSGVFEPFVTNAVHDVLSGASAAVDASLEEAAAALSSSVESLGERVGRLGVALPAFNENLFSGIADRTMLEQLTDSCAQQIAIPIAEKLSEIAAFLLVFAAAYLLLCLAFKLLNLVARLPILNEANRILGVAAGVLLGAVYTYLAAQLLSLILGMLVANSTLPAEVLDGPLFGFLTQGSPQ
ncbi:MAG: CvpA family protein [Clostridia bacterium]|nr:CvpA family protein [Clostridia bacterium]